MLQFLFLTLIFCLTRFYHLGSQSYWIDEMVSVHFSAHESWKALFWDNHPPLYHLMLKGWVYLFGTSEFATRSLSVLLSYFSLTTLYHFIQKKWGNNAAFWAGVLFLLSSLTLTFAQEARMYALFELAATINMVCFFSLLEKKPQATRNYFFSALFLASTHYLAFIPLLFQGGYFIFHKDYRRKTWWALGSIALLVSLAFFFGFNPTSLEWQRLRFESPSLAQQNYYDLLQIFNYSTGCLFIFLGLSIWHLYRKRIKPEVRFAVLFILTTLFLFFVGQFVLGRYLLYPRYFIFLNSYIIFSLLYLLPRHLILAVLFAVLAFTQFPENYEPTKAPWREAAATIENHGGGKVLTTRTLAIQTPYLSAASAEAVKLKTDSPMLDQVVQEVETNTSIWILENYWGGVSYIEVLKQQLLQRNYQVKDFSLAGPKGEDLYLLQVRK